MNSAEIAQPVVSPPAAEMPTRPPTRLPLAPQAAPGAPAALRVVIYEGAGSAALSDAERFEAMKALLEKGYAVTRAAVTRAAGTQGGGQVARADDSALLVLGKFDAGQPPTSQAEDSAGGVAVHFRDVAGADAAGVVALAEAVRGQVQPSPAKPWKPWFPVIDYGRCTNCMQCLSFCLFDVYGASGEGKIQVQNPAKCKTDCPACSRVCPEVAILFPKYRSGPINGDEVSEQDLQREKMKIDISALLGGDIYSALRDRSARAQSRFAKERDDERALKERMRCLQKLSQDLDIPPEVFSSLPSPDQIRLKAEQAMAAAAARNAVAND